MAETLDAQITTRVTSRDKRELESVAADRHMEALALARALLREGIRRERHPGITFRAGAAGRRAAIEGHRLDVWQVMETVWAADGNVDEAAATLGLRAGQVRAAVTYYADYPTEIDALVARNREMAERLEEQWRREQAALTR